MKNNFPILSIETSSELCSAAVMSDEKTFFEMNILKKQIHSEKLLEMIDIILNSSKLSLKDLSFIAVSIGPGSFTGLRIGLTAAKSLAFGSNLPIVPVPTFSAFALQINDYISNGEKFGIIRNASIEDFYYATFNAGQPFKEWNSEVKLYKKTEIEKIDQNNKLFGDMVENLTIKHILGPNASNIARWSYFFGSDLLTYNYDYLEPYYLKNFIAKVKR
jgi:tRNA threonylcarbamoyladenosine biosynthesis protein TsaB